MQRDKDRKCKKCHPVEPAIALTIHAPVDFKKMNPQANQHGKFDGAQGGKEQADAARHIP